MSDKGRVQSILQLNAHMVLATADETGKPWVTPVAYSFDAQNNLYWMSAKTSRHSLNLQARREVAIVIYMLEPKSDALYIEAEAQELSEAQDITAAIPILHTRKQPKKYTVTSVEDVSDQAAWRIYKAVPTAMYVRVRATVEDQVVTRRRRIT